MFKTIVVGTDGSKHADRALRAAADLAKQSPETKVHVVTAYRPLTEQQVRDITSSLPNEYRDLIHAHYGAESILETARQIFKVAHVDADFYEFNGDPTEAVLGAVEREKADLVVVGSRGEGAAARALHGSVSTKLIHHAPCSVLVVR